MDLGAPIIQPIMFIINPHHTRVWQIIYGSLMDHYKKGITSVVYHTYVYQNSISTLYFPIIGMEFFLLKTYPKCSMMGVINHHIVMSLVLAFDTFLSV